MSMSDQPTASEIQMRLRELLGRATLHRARGERQQAIELAQQAVALDDGSWEAHELVGDLLLEMGKGEMALASYRRALTLNASRGALEEKIGRAALARAARQQAAAMSEALLSGTVKLAPPPRKPAMAALLSLVVPGLGQLYNGETVKAFLLAALFLAILGLTSVAVRANVPVGAFSGRGALYGPRVDAAAVLAGLFSGVTAVWTVLLIALYIYAIADAALKASRSMTSDHTGVV